MLSFLILSRAVAVSAATITVAVGKGGLVYDPNNIKAAKGDIISFQFVAGVHSVSQSGGVDVPCAQLEGGFDSAFVPATLYTQVWNLTIEDDSRSIWFYCRQANHCQQGMAGVINAASPDLINTYITNAKAVTGPQPAPRLILQGIGASASKAPVLADESEGQTPPVNGVDSSTTLPVLTVGASQSITPLSSPTPISTASAPTDPAATAPAKEAVIPIVATIAALIVAVGVAIVFVRQRRRRRNRKREQPPTEEVVAYAIPTWAARTSAPPQTSKLDLSMSPEKAGPAQSTSAELEELHSAMQRAGVSVQTLLASVRGPREDMSEASLPRYEA